MNDAPRSYLTPADRDAAVFEAARLRALELRREAMASFWTDVGRLLRRGVGALSRRARRSGIDVMPDSIRHPYAGTARPSIKEGSACSS